MAGDSSTANTQTGASTGTTMTPESLNAPAPLQTATVTPDTTNHNAITSSVTQGVIDDYNNITKPADDTATSNQNSLAQSITGLMGQDANKAVDTAADNTAAGVDDATNDVNTYTSQLADLNAQATSLNREAQAIPIQTQQNNQNTGATDAGIAPQNAGALRENALKALSIGQQADVANAALTGSNIRLQAAQAKAQQMIDLKYQPIEAELAAKQSQYTMNKDALDALDKKASDELGVSLQKEATDTANAKETETANTNMILNAQVQGASPAVVAAAKAVSDAGGSTLEVGSKLGAYAGDVLGTQLKKAQIVEANANAAKTIADTATAAAASDPSNLAQQLISGNLAPSELSKRANGANGYNATLQTANALSLKTTGKPFNIAQADRNYKFATNVQTQNTLNGLSSLIGTVDSSGNITGGNLSALKNLSNSLPRTNFPAVNSVEWNALLQTGNPDVVAYMTNVTEVADQIAKVLQGGSTGGTSDAKLNQASQIFNKNFSVDQINAVVNTIQPLLVNRAKGMIGDNPYLSDYATQFGLDNPGQVGGMANNPYSAALNPSLNTSAPITSGNGTYNIPSN